VITEHVRRHSRLYRLTHSGTDDFLTCGLQVQSITKKLKGAELL